MRAREDNRQLNREMLKGEPLRLPAGLAHVIATVLEPRSDGMSSNERFDAVFEDEKKRLLHEIDLMVAENGHVPTAHLGGRIEHIVDQAEARVRAAAELTGADDVVRRLAQLDNERRSGVSGPENAPTESIDFDLSSIPRSSSGRRVGVWR